MPFIVKQEAKPRAPALQLFCQRHVISPKATVILLDSYHMLWGRAGRIPGEEAFGADNTDAPWGMSSWKDREQTLSIVSQSSKGFSLFSPHILGEVDLCDIWYLGVSILWGEGQGHKDDELGDLEHSSDSWGQTDTSTGIEEAGWEEASPVSPPWREAGGHVLLLCVFPNLRHTQLTASRKPKL